MSFLIKMCKNERIIAAFLIRLHLFNFFCVSLSAYCSKEGTISCSIATRIRTSECERAKTTNMELASIAQVSP